jgi:hypothetical protein
MNDAPQRAAGFQGGISNPAAATPFQHPQERVFAAQAIASPSGTNLPQKRGNWHRKSQFMNTLDPKSFIYNHLQDPHRKLTLSASITWVKKRDFFKDTTCNHSVAYRGLLAYLALATPW